jgi:sugar/nucleoside kinase (ribokinase family)
MAWPDPDAASGKVDWRSYLENVLPAVDLFLPSVDELLFMLDPGMSAAVQKKADGGNPAAHLGVDAIRAMAERMIGFGAAMVGLKLGDRGFYLRTTADASRLAAMGHAAPADSAAWLDKELIAGCRAVTVAGTTGAGDCTIAGFLGALLKGLSAEEAVLRAVCVGGASVEARDANSGVPAWEAMEGRLAAGWPAVPSAVIPAGWRETASGVFART